MFSKLKQERRQKQSSMMPHFCGANKICEDWALVYRSLMIHVHCTCNKLVWNRVSPDRLLKIHLRVINEYDLHSYNV